MMDDNLTGLELAKFIILRLVENNESIEQLAEDFENDVRFITRVVTFLKDIGWIKEDSSTRSYQMSDVISLKVSSSRMVR
ncbi:MAG TPA: hypothetical protein VE544_01095 [Nitrososphaeraceae archaeon]|nr:hypothetical protein [Nitrososphaeraceae archaeon]